MENMTQSAFQQQFPLSSKKFTKKMLGTLIFWSLLVLVFLVFAIVASAVASVQAAFPYAWLVFFIVLAVAIIILSLRSWYVKTYIRRYFYSASDDFITIKKGVFTPAEIHVQYPKIQDVYVDQDILDRILGIYDVHIASATVASSIEAHIDGVDETVADGLKAFFLGKISSGGGKNSSASAMASSDFITTSAPAETAAPINASQMISSDQYPISPIWLRQQAVLAVFNSLWAGFIAGIYLQATTIGVFAGIIVFALVLAGHLGYNVIWKKNFRFAFLPDYILLSTMALVKSEQHMPYRTVQDVIVKQGFIEKLLGLATVSIQNAAVSQIGRGRNMSQAVNIPGQTPESANKIAEIVRGIALSKNSAKTGL